MNVWAVSIPLIGLIVAMTMHIVIMARWSGKVDANLAQIMTQPAQAQAALQAMGEVWRNELIALRAEIKVKLDFLESEVKSLRDVRHELGNKVAVHEGQLTEMRHRFDRFDLPMGPR